MLNLETVLRLDHNDAGFGEANRLVKRSVLRRSEARLALYKERKPYREP